MTAVISIKSKNPRFPALAVFVLLASTGSLIGQENSCLDRTIPVSVLSADVRFVDGLTSKNFTAKVQGKEVKIVSLVRDSGPRRIVIVLDASGSMEDVWKLEETAAQGLIESDPRNSFALIVFGSQVLRTIDFSQNRAAITDALPSLQPPERHQLRKTALLDALASSIELLRPPGFGDAIYLVSDGQDNDSQLGISQFRNRLMASGVRLFALMPLDNAVSKGLLTPEGKSTPGELEADVAASGGDFTIFHLGADGPPTARTKPGKPIGLWSGGQQVMFYGTKGFDAEITNVYRLTLRLPEPIKKPRELQLYTLGADGKKNGSWLVIYPNRLASCR
jgi:hypothetical protein